MISILKISATVFLLLTFVGCEDHKYVDYTKYKDFDLNKTRYHIDTLNSGDLILTEHYEGSMWGEHYKVIDGLGDFVVSRDTCYLKYRAYKFWLNEVKK